MKGLLVDSSVVLDIITDDPTWADWSQQMLARYVTSHRLYINPIIYTEVSIGFERIEEVEFVISNSGLKILQIPREALFLAGKAFLRYKKHKGSKSSTLPDFFIGAHAAVSQLAVLTRDVTRIRTYFPTVRIIAP
ncbi:MAG TPA: PIN domain-containing protein [Spirochaetota bacterium]|nr:PIN domain-containing protein [Spirochaetota bacterium]HNT13151.1 PIN domain-containing protein [Spirochaetota bacterium]HOS39813.1 PIN domain-containing protein [Spirochaetota bacterium]